MYKSLQRIYKSYSSTRQNEEKGRKDGNRREKKGQSDITKEERKKTTKQTRYESW